MGSRPSDDGQSASTYGDDHLPGHGPGDPGLLLPGQAITGFRSASHTRPRHERRGLCVVSPSRSCQPATSRDSETHAAVRALAGLRRHNGGVHRAGVGGRRGIRRWLGHPHRALAARARGILAALAGASGDRSEPNRTCRQKANITDHSRSPSWTETRTVDRADRVQSRRLPAPSWTKPKDAEAPEVPSRPGLRLR